MKLFVSACKPAVQVQPVNFKGGLNMEPFFRRKDKVVFVMGATGTGKSRLAIELATRFPAEIVNSDKIQVYKGLDIATNKVTEEESKGVPHHLLGIIEPDSNFTATDFRNQASLAIESILARDRHPIIAGGSNSYVEALVNHDFQLRYECCFLWVDVLLPVLDSFVSERVDRMVELGLVDEVRSIFDPHADYSRGIRRAIGVPELDQFLRAESFLDDETRIKFLEAAIAKIKENNCTLAFRQLQKIRRLHRLWKWNMHRIDATEVFLKRGVEADQAWEEVVRRPSNMIVEQFLYDEDHMTTIVSPGTAATTTTANTIVKAPPMPVAAVAAASR